jgi:RNA polymerase sigma-70 factor, ECF subfamily
MHLVPRYNSQMTTSQPTTRSGSGPSDAALVVAARADEAWAKEALFRRYAHVVNGLAYRLIGRDEDLDDLVQDSFVEAWRSLHRLDNPQAFGSWLCSIVVRTAHKLLRRRRLMSALGLRHRDSIELDTLIAPSAPQDVLVELRAIYALVETLPPMARVAFLLRRVEGVGLDEIADMLGVSLATVKRRIAAVDRQLTAWSAVHQQPIESISRATTGLEGS